MGSPHGVGFTAGLVSGLGFGYRKHFENRFGVQIGGVGWGSRTESFVSLGVEALRTLSRSDSVRFYGLAGASVFRNNRQEYDYSACYLAGPPVANCSVESQRITTGSLNFGVGIGMEFMPGRHVSVSVELPLSLMLDLEKASRFDRQGIYPIPSVSLIYYF